MSEPLVSRPARPAALAGNPRALLRQLGDLTGWDAGEMSAHVSPPPVKDLAGLGAFLQWYHDQLLVPVELPLILRAWHHASRGQARELIALDRALVDAPAWAPFAGASQAVGRSQLRRLRPLRDQRFVGRYREAIERGEARGWHGIVYGLVLAVFSFPLRPGLICYGRQTLESFAGSAAQRLGLPVAEVDRVLEETLKSLPDTVEAELQRHADLAFQPDLPAVEKGPARVIGVG